MLTEYDLLSDLLEEGLEYDDYRIRHTLILIGDLLNGLAGNEGSVSYENSNLRFCAGIHYAILPDSELPQYIDWYRTCIRSLKENIEYGDGLLLGFCIKQGLKQIMNIFNYETHL
eukprot:110760_1